MGSNYPVPTRLVLLCDLPKVSVGTKVRFLGCVESYDLIDGALTLAHCATPTASETVKNTSVVAAAPELSTPLPPTWTLSPSKRKTLHSPINPLQPLHEYALTVLDTSLVLPRLAAEPGLVEVGSWLHVTGYVSSSATSIEALPTCSDSQDEGESESDEAVVGATKAVKVTTVGVQAQLVWEAKGLDLSRYEQAVRRRGKLTPNSVLKA